VDGWQATHIDDISSEQWPYWAPIRHHFGIRAFGINAWRGGPGDEVIKHHDETESGHEELYLVLSGRATFTLGGEEVDAPEGMCVCVTDPAVERVAVAEEPNTVVLSLSSKPGGAYEGGWDTAYLEA
jgi:quercetin dioxygenase-like cupin family protein